MGRGLGASWSDGIFSLGLGVEEDEGSDGEGLGLMVETGLPVECLEMVLAMRLDLGLLWWSDEDLVLDTDDEFGFVAAADDGMLGLGGGLLALVFRLMLLLFSLRWLLYELRLGSL